MTTLPPLGFAWIVVNIVSLTGDSNIVASVEYKDKFMQHLMYM